MQPLPATVTARIVTFLVGDPYESSFFHCQWEEVRMPNYPHEMDSSS